ncbi:hypothetical protein M2G88_04725 [Vibrio vulnificus]|nr:hypothetical protein [Vibrio vulnificus]
MNKKYSVLSSLLGFFLLLAVFFPWVSFGLNSMDTQPWAFLVSLCFLISCYRDITFEKLIWPILLALFSVVSALFYLGDDISAIVRGVFSYWFLVTVFVACWIYFYRYGFPCKTIYFCNLVYLLVAVVQYNYGGTIFDFIAIVRTTESRGVTSLAIEPTNFGLVLLLFSWFYLIIRDYSLNRLDRIFVFLNFFSILFLAKSSMTIVFVFIFFIFAVLYRLNILYVGALFLLIFFLGDVFVFLFPEARVSQLFREVSYIGSLDLVKNDASLNYRISSAIFPYQGLLGNIFFPGGFSSFKNVAIELKENSQGLFWYGEHKKIMSFIGSFIYEMGIVGVMFVISFMIAIQNGSYRRVIETAYLFLLLNMAIPVASPIVSFLLCILLYTRGGQVERYTT